jgi:hypothetical protein
MQTIAARCGLTRRAVYDAAEGIMGDEVQHLLSQVLVEVPVQEMIEAAAGLGRHGGLADSCWIGKLIPQSVTYENDLLSQTLP